MNNLERYKQYRQTQVKLHTKILDDYIDEVNFKQAGHTLGVLNNRNQVVMEHETEYDALYDFNIYERLRAGKSSLSLFAENYSPEDQIENELIASMLQSQASLYEVIHIDKTEGVLVLKDILNDLNELVKIIDISLSSNTISNPLLFTRVLNLEGFSMTSGLGFVFFIDHKDYILNRSRKMIKKMKSSDTSLNNFITYFHLNRSDGISMRFENVK
ncbi:hypothetical protein HZF08_35400 [Paenibacillus sp. CGMCC 1.16610]|uniref:DUF1444 family protein n=1 Tax=Paenibacillus anseongense TaxID=2682845 RepID=A0ABW9TYY2_9BACL|nr:MULTISPECIES: hypothetical protein [Paenibacillus]MBA2943563.1 hypothetical protein [Paenibacillus sp. CGMCC 1.16610]MVQ33057.1 hypothetical protein [Paenibacillus anseongense]